MTNPDPELAGRLRRPSRPRSVVLGNVKLTYVPDGAVELNARGWFPGSDDAVWGARPEYLDESGNLSAGIGALLVERDGRSLLIDTGFGPHSIPPQPGNPRGAIHGGALLDELAALGKPLRAIEAVAFTHLHLDHIGWACSARPGTSLPPFTDASYYVPEPEWEQRHLLEPRGVTPAMLETMAPRVHTVADGEEIFPGVRVRLTPGHTPGHACYVITSGSQRLIAFGDAMHSPIQVSHPEWAAAPDLDPVQASEHRRRLVDDLAKPGTLGFGVHFADVVFGRVRPGGDQLVWQPA